MIRHRMVVTIVTRDDTTNKDMQEAVEKVLGNSELVCAEEMELLVGPVKTARNEFQDATWQGYSYDEYYIDAWYEAAKLFAEGD